MTAMMTVMTVPMAHAGELYCGANAEKEVGSGVYNKSLFWEKTDISKPKIRYVLADGTVISPELQNPDDLKKIVVDGTLWVGFMNQNNGLQLMSGSTYHDAQGEIKYKNLAIASGVSEKQSLLMANGVAVMCVQK